jgi:alpha-glucosidase
VAPTADWWRGAVIYQIYPRSFQDSNGDGIGDLQGITRRLGHVADLGVDAVWISPFFASPMKDFGYDVSDYRRVDPLFGTLEDFDELLATAHRLGLKVVIDLVMNHTSDRHAWFQESRSSRTNPRADWYVWADPKPDGTAPNNWLSVFGGSAWHWDSRRRQYYLHNFLASQPDLNLHEPQVREALSAEVRFWLERGFDGFRLDAANYYFHDRQLRDNPPAARADESEQPAANPYAWQQHLYDKSRPEMVPFLQQLRRLFDEYPGIMTLGEIGDGARSLELMAAYSAGGDKLDTCYATDFLRGPFEPGFFRRTLERFAAEAGDGWPCWAFSNHDAPRHVSRWAAPSQDRSRLAKLAGALLLSLRGSVCLYQGEELGLPEADIAFEDLVDPYGIEFWPEYKGRDGCRTPMLWEAGSPSGGFSAGKPWLPVPEAHLALAVDRQREDTGSVLAAYREMLSLRRRHRALRLGSIEFLDVPPGMLAFVRRHEEEAVLCAFNLGDRAATLQLPDGLRVTGLPGRPLQAGQDAGPIAIEAFESCFGLLAAAAAAA